jgi:uncharacterized protein (DUF1015 family)
MAQLYPFRALRYDTTRVNLHDVVTQPYDKISPEMQDAYYAASPYNLIRVILGKKFPADTDAENVYTRAAATLTGWRAEGILREEAEPALYGYSQTYTVPGTDEVRERRGFIALGHLYDYADHVVYRHEQTFPKHKSDRLALFKATRAYCEQIYMLYSDPTFTAEQLIFGAKDDTTKPADLEVTDEYNVQHRVWKLTDPALIEQVLAAMADKKLIIADGHHRYETSVGYMHERAAELGIEASSTTQELSSRPDLAPNLSSRPERSAVERPASPAAAQLPTPAFPEAAMMMTFVNAEAPGITILPTHRVLFGLTDFSSADFITKASRFFSIDQLPDAADAPTLLKRLNETAGTAIIAATTDGNYLLRGKPEVIDAELADVSPNQRSLEVVQLHKILIEKVLGLDEATVRAGTNVRYIREATEALAEVTNGTADITFLIKPVTLQQMMDISLNLEVMPQKSTDFYPKLLSGLAMYTLD